MTTKGQWHGTHIPGPAYFSFDHRPDQFDFSFDHRPDQSDLEQEQKFKALLARMEALSKTADGNGQPVLKFVYTRFHHSSPVVAYQFTSEWAYNRYTLELIGLGASLARGTWDVFSSDPAASWCFQKFCGATDFTRMNVANLRVWYVQEVGYDPLDDDEGAMSVDELRMLCISVATENQTKGRK